MTPPLALGRPDGLIYRVARVPDARAWPEWAYAHEDGTFGNRFDDPRGEYRVLNASSQREGAFTETLARYRVDLQIAAEYQLIHGDPEDAAYPDAVPAGVVRENGSTRGLSARPHTTVGSSTSVTPTRWSTSGRRWPIACCTTAWTISTPARFGARPRAFTQEISRYVFEQGRDDSGQAVALVGAVRCAET